MLDQVEDEIVDTRVFERARAELGGAFLRILSYFREDGVKAVDRIEHAMRNGDSASLVLPAHTLKGEARHFGALSLGDLAETIEMGARRCVDHQETPEELLVPVARLRSMFEQTLAWFDKETNPLVARRKQQNHAS
ncbi:histidine phosphotransferase [Tardibacter chloracetimidivorans]|uniref:Histidine phosphotransferase n=1 Tax=Tardibacter chloracetimidivorans TaxID=1921510 RepID=A0A1L3ZUE3_9SPHN|nr:Hpt domain-containing protein [Tardibacter chloracetimidivorans]API59245.1 histidine phosphotransferase [Tardibacter chloracetimidivorans]